MPTTRTRIARLIVATATTVALTVATAGAALASGSSWSG